jgi:hypothetical protein
VVATIHGGFIIGKEFGKKDLQEKWFPALASEGSQILWA